jgi:uncharacterized membrane protein
MNEFISTCIGVVIVAWTLGGVVIFVENVDRIKRRFWQYVVLAIICGPLGWFFGFVFLIGHVFSRVCHSPIESFRDWFYKEY